MESVWERDEFHFDILHGKLKAPPHQYLSQKHDNMIYIKRSTYDLHNMVYINNMIYMIAKEQSNYDKILAWT